MSFSSTTIKDLRERTGAGMLDCKKALEETSGDIEKAIDYLRTKGLAKAAKKAERAATEGVVSCLVSPDKKSGFIMEVNSETDFVAKNDKFQTLIQSLTSHGLQQKTNDLESFKNSKMGSKTVHDCIQDVIATIGENITLRRITYLNDPEGYMGSYIHMGGAVGTLVHLKFQKLNPNTLETIAKDVCMHTAATAPRYLNRTSVDTTDLNREKEVLKQEVLASGKPPAMVDKIVGGKISKFYTDFCLLEQEFIKDPDLNVEAFVNKTAMEAGGKAEVKNFVYYKKGEGLQKKEENFADEVAKMTR